VEGLALLVACPQTAKSHTTFVGSFVPQLQMDTLRSYEGFLASLRCFDWLPDIVSGASDIDCCITHHGSVLIIEAKPREGPKVHVPLGQFRSLLDLAAKGIDVWLVAEDEEAKTDLELPRYSRLVVGANTKPHFQGIRNGQKQAGFYTDSRFDSFTLQQLQDAINSWWTEQ